MLKRIGIRNLRSIKDQEIEVAPITVLYGSNGSGKSTVMHALAILRNVVLNPNQPLDSFFNFPFANFGGFEQVVFNHNPREQIELVISDMQDSTQVDYKAILGKQRGGFCIRAARPWDATLEIETIFPYPTNQQKSVTMEYEGTPITVTWNGVLAQPGATQTPEAAKNTERLTAVLNGPVEELRRCDFVHLKRGFSKPHYGTAPLTPHAIFTEDEVATLLANDRYLEGKVSHYLEEMLGRDLRVRPSPGTTLFWLNTTDKATGLLTEIVNEGFGINQVVYLLAKSLQRDVSIVCIEEPEIHLHPRALRNLAYAFVRMIQEEKKTMIISTHSEHLVLSLLGAVAKGQLNSDEITCYLCSKDKKESKFERQRVHPDGRVEGGLATFLEGELEDLKDILGVSKAVE